MATDIYALGVVPCTNWSLATGPITPKPSKNCKRKKLSQAPILPSKYVPDLPIRVERTILRCLARDPEERFGKHAGDVVAALRRRVDVGHFWWQLR